MSNRHIGHHLDTASNDDIVRAGGNESHAGGNGLIRTNAGHGDGMRWRAVAEAGAQGRFASNVRGFHLLNDGAVNDVIDEVLVEFGFAQQAPVKFRDTEML